MIFKEETAEELRKKTREEIIADIRRDTLILDLMFLEVKRDIEELLVKHKSNPHVHLQPRHPRGTSEGGQWMATGSSSTPSVSRDRDGSFQIVSDYPSNTRSGTPKVTDEPIESTKITIPDPYGRPVNRVNIFIGGASDETIKNVKDSDSLKHDTYGDNYYASQLDGNDFLGTKKINKFIEKLPKDTIINLIGHSYGGDTAADIVLDNPGRINLLITVDPVSLFQPDFEKVRKSVRKWININATGERNDRGERRTTGGDLAAGFGRAWNNGPKDYSYFITALFSHESFDSMLKHKPSMDEISAQEILNMIR